MAYSKYERRVSEAQTLINKAPHSLVTWGNVIMLGIVLCFISFTKLVSISRTTVLPGRMESTPAQDDKKIIVMMDSPLPINLESSGHIQLVSNSGSSTSALELVGHLDSAWNGTYGAGVKVILAQPLSYSEWKMLHTGVGCTIQFELHPISFFGLLYNKKH